MTMISTMATAAAMTPPGACASSLRPLGATPAGTTVTSGRPQVPAFGAMSSGVPDGRCVVVGRRRPFVFDFGGTLVNLLAAGEAPELVAPAPVASSGAGVRSQLTLDVDDVDAACAQLVERGVALLNGPMDRPWGIRTAAFRDPGGHVWEVAGPLR
jgi:catechol 2,3-dioxygenase-like lactoylglutathione lyase family enzyme